jgi:hypothetical protein
MAPLRRPFSRYVNGAIGNRTQLPVAAERRMSRGGLCAHCRRLRGRPLGTALRRARLGWDARGGDASHCVGNGLAVLKEVHPQNRRASSSSSVACFSFLPFEQGSVQFHFWVDPGRWPHQEDSEVKLVRRPRSAKSVGCQPHSFKKCERFHRRKKYDRHAESHSGRCSAETVAVPCEECKFFFSCAVACRDFAASTLLIRSSLPAPFLSDDEVEFVRDSGSTGHSLFQLLFFEAFHRWHAGEFLRGAEE